MNKHDLTIFKSFEDMCRKTPSAPFLISPSRNQKDMTTFSYQETFEKANKISASFFENGYGNSMRVATLLGSTPAHYIVKLALNKIGVSVVPINPDYSPDETAYLLADSGSVLAICAEDYIKQLKTAIAYKDLSVPIVIYDEIEAIRPIKRVSDFGAQVHGKTEASLLYTSGTTGRPKGCILSHEYELMCGDVYANIGAPISLSFGKDKILNPLPSYHINAGIVTFFAAMLTGNSLIQPERFSISSWWEDINETEATIFHYLGVIIAVLLSDQSATKASLCKLRVGFGAGVEPALHQEFETRFGIPLIECWGMTEMCRVLYNNDEPRQIHTRAMGRPREDLQVKVVDENDQEVEIGMPGEMVVRHSEKTPRVGAFSGYLNKEKETEEAWKNGWFHTGDTVTMDETGMMYFVDRAKNIIRRAGENIAAAEIENCLFEIEFVSKIACIAVKDDIREEEVMACVVLEDGKKESKEVAEILFDHAIEKMAYFKAPGYILFMDDLPVTGTQKVVKHKIFEPEIDPRNLTGVFNFTHLKKRKPND
ncbi:AMP-binding protein [Paracoccaceae bacterium]|nr:AMP-binding protein [Paracoccaceae bacterium]